MNSLGIYFGTQVVSLVETKGNKILNNLNIPRTAVSPANPADEKVPEEVKLTAMIKNELKKSRIEAKEATLGLSGKDLIIRTFQIPLLPRQELEGAINSEIRKYIPFKVEELDSGFQWKVDKAIQKTHVLFVGIKKDNLNKYLNVVKELGIKATAVEYSAFSLLRLTRIASVNTKGIVAIANLDLSENDEANFLVLENGFPLFSRDIPFLGVQSQEAVKAESAENVMILDKLRREVRISLDYYDRTFPLKSIEKIFFVMGRDYRMDIEAFIREMGLGVQFVNVDKSILKTSGKLLPFSLSFLKAYCCALSKIDISFKINLLSEREKVAKDKAQLKTSVALFPKLPGLNLDLLIFAAGLLVCVVTFLSGTYRILPLQKQLKETMALRPAVSSVPAESSYDALVSAEAGYKIKIKVINEAAKKKLHLTEILDAIPRVIPEDVHLTEAIFRRAEKSELILRGTAYSGDSNKELEQVNAFLARLKTSAVFMKYFKEMVIVTIDHPQVQDVSITNFVISCKE